jgi:hypothetical protein
LWCSCRFPSYTSPIVPEIFTESNSEGFRPHGGQAEQAKGTKILAGILWISLQKMTKEPGVPAER